MRVLVFGGRYYPWESYVWEQLSLLRPNWGPTPKIIQGCAIGVDTFARKWAAHHLGEQAILDFPVTIAMKEKYGYRAAPVMRNQMMIDWGEPDFAVKFPGGTGTDDMLRRVVKHKIPYRIVEDDRWSPKK